MAAVVPPMKLIFVQRKDASGPFSHVLKIVFRVATMSVAAPHNLQLPASLLCARRARARARATGTWRADQPYGADC